MNYFSVMKRSTQLIHTRIWINPKCTMLGEKSQSQKIPYNDYMYMTFWRRQNYRDEEEVN